MVDSHKQQNKLHFHSLGLLIITFFNCILKTFKEIVELYLFRYLCNFLNKSRSFEFGKMCTEQMCYNIPLEGKIYNCHFKTVVKKSKEIIIIRVSSGHIEFLNIYLELANVAFILVGMLL